MIDSTTVIGVAGATIVLTAFVLTQLHEWKNSYLIYEFFNFVGSTLLVVYAILLQSYPFIILNLVWGGVSLFYVYIDLIRNAHRTTRTWKRKTLFERWCE